MKKQTFDIPAKPVDNPGLWYNPEIGNTSWRQTLPDNIVDELLAAVEGLSKINLCAPGFDVSHINTPVASAYLKQLQHELEAGSGFAVLRGAPAAGYSQTDMENLFWVIGLQLGRAVTINADGDLIGHVTDLGYDLNKPTVRNYQTSEELTFHNDSCDVLGLMCLQPAKSGGNSAIASAIAIHNDIQRTRPDLLAELYQPLPIDRRGEKGWADEDDRGWFALPVFSYVDEKVSARYTVHDYYYQSQKHTDAPRLTDKQQEALEYLKSTSQDPRFHINFELSAGDIQLVNNYCVFHSRTSYEDYPEPHRKRHLLRLWLSTPDSRRLHPIFAPRFRSAEPGALRGGIAPRA